MSDQEHTPSEPTEEPIEDLDVSEEQQDDVTGGKKRGRGNIEDSAS